MPRRLRPVVDSMRCLAVLAAATGCDQFTFAPITTPRPQTLPPISDRVRAAYTDTASGRFVTIADFEAVEQAGIFQVAAATGAGQVGITADRSRPETGAGALRVEFQQPSDVLVGRDRESTVWSLIRNWDDYHLFLASVYSPRDNVVLNFEVRSGETVPAVYRQTGLPLREGWNLLRLDLADMGEWVNLSDVRELRFSCHDLVSPVELHFDDLILTDNRKDVLGSPDGETGGLYVRTQGRRMHVGAVGRFEVVFARGRIVQWFDLGSDPERRWNLAGFGSLGPVPLVLASDDLTALDPDDEQQWQGLGPVVQSRQTLLEASPFRVVVECEWLFLPAAGGDADAEHPHHRTTFTLYPQGRLFVGTDWDIAGPAWRAEHVGVALATDRAAGFRSVRHAPEPSATASDARSTSYVVHARGRPGRSDLLFVLHRPADGSVIRSAEIGRGARLLSTFVAGTDDSRSLRTSGLMAVWPTDLDREGNADTTALDYVSPGRIAAQVGRVVQTDEGDADNDGYDESAGYYVLALDGDVGRFTFQAGDYVRFYPVFKLIDTGDREVWVYVDGRQLRTTSRDAAGDWLFQIPSILNRDVLIEVHAAARSDPLSLQ